MTSEILTIAGLLLASLTGAGLLGWVALRIGEWRARVAAEATARARAEQLAAGERTLEELRRRDAAIATAERERIAQLRAEDAAARARGGTEDLEALIEQGRELRLRQLGEDDDTDPPVPRGTKDGDK